MVITLSILSTDSTIVATLIVSISTSFSSLKTLSWIGSAYLIGQSAIQPLSGRLTDIFGRREGLIVSNIAFASGTLLCGLATREWVLIMGRAIAGLGGGAISAISMFVTGDLVPLRKRGVIQGIGNIAIGSGSGLGGLLGGWIDGIWGWRAAFWIQVPFVVISAVVVSFTVKIPTKASRKPSFRRVDYLGSLTLVGVLVIFLLGVNAGGNTLPWTHPLVLSTFPLSGTLLLIFVYVEERVAFEPIIPVRLLLDRTIAAACLCCWFAFMAYYGITFYMPVYLQVLGNTPTEAGIRFIASSAGTAAGALGVGVVMRATGNYSYVNKATNALMVLASGLMASLQLNTPPWCPFVYLGLFGFGFGGMLVTTLTALVSSVEQENQAVITSTAFAFRATGSAIGLTIASAVFQNLLRVELGRSLGGGEIAENVIDRIRDNFDEIKHLPEGVVGNVLENYIEALRGVFLLACGSSILAALMSLFMRQNKLHSNLARS